MLPLVVLLTLFVRPAAAQFPGELRGRVVSAGSGAPVVAAVVEIPGAGRSALTDATGAFLVRGLDPGIHEVLVRHIGFAVWSDDVEVRNGRVTTVRVALIEVAVALDGVVVTAEGGRTAGGTRIARAEIERTGARTAGDVVRRTPGVVLREESVGGAQTVSIRGSGADAVLVLLDGVPLNDPVTGVADLSTVPAGAIETVTVLPGAQGARYGPRAEAGVVLVETRAPAAGVVGRVAGGSLGERGVGAEASGSAGGLALAIGGQLREIDGEFDFARVPGVDETVMRRANADVTERGAFASARARLGGGDLRARVGAEELDRGIPGRGYAPSTRARQEMDRLRGSLSWGRAAREVATSLAVAGVSQRVRYVDPAPPFGLPYDDVTRARSWEARGEIDRLSTRSGAGGPVGLALRGHGAGVELAGQYVDAGSLADGAPRSRTDLGAFLHAAVGTAIGAWDAELTVQARADRDDVTADWYLNRAVNARLSGAGVTLQIGNRSGYSPPSLGDQFFREGVGVTPNPNLRAERIPSEWEFSASAARVLGAVDAAAGISAYAGDVRGMIVWMPDFRFVWSPRNVDVNRRGLEAWAEVTNPRLGFRLAGSYSLAAVTRDLGPGGEGVQLAYRPRHTGQLGAAWERAGWRAEVGAAYTGLRYPANAEVNALDPFWTFNLDLGREWRLAGTTLDTSVRVDRLLDEKDTLIFGFPEAGRRIRIEARIHRASSPEFPGETQ